MLATNKEIRSKEDVIKVALAYFSRWQIEEYFRCKKQMFHFENFRVRKLAAINSLNFYITLCMAFLAHISMKSGTNALRVAIIQKADPVKEKVHFCYYRLAKGISGILSYAKEGVRLWFRTKIDRLVLLGRYTHFLITVYENSRTNYLSFRSFIHKTPFLWAFL